MSDSKPHLFNTIRLAKAEKKQFVEQLNENAPAVTAVANRRRLRVVYNVGDLLLTLIQSKKSTVNYAVVPRNLSTHGIGFLHGQYVHRKSECHVVLKTLDGKFVCVKGWIINCRYVSGSIHEISMHFESPIDLTLFVELDIEQQQKLAQDKEADKPIISSYCDKDGLAKDISKFVQDINTTIKLLVQATEQANVEALGEICKQMQETSRTCGFEPVSEVADVLLTTLDQSADDMTLIDEQVAALIAVAQRIGLP